MTYDFGDYQVNLDELSNDVQDSMGRKVAEIISRFVDNKTTLDEINDKVIEVDNHKFLLETSLEDGGYESDGSFEPFDEEMLVIKATEITQ